MNPIPLDLIECLSPEDYSDNVGASRYAQDKMANWAASNVATPMGRKSEIARMMMSEIKRLKREFDGPRRHAKV